MNKGSWGKVRAFFDLTTQEGFTIKGFKIIEGINGLFVSMPSRKGTDDEGNDKWFDTIWIESRETREKLNTLAIDEYNNDSEGDSNNTSPETMTETTTTGDNIKEEAPSQDAEKGSNAPAFSDDDIPF